MEMDKDFVLEMANTIKDQLVGMTPLNVICSWGIEKFVATEYKGMAALKFHVNGRLFRGNVIIAYNALDYYEVFAELCRHRVHRRGSVFLRTWRCH